MCSLFGVLNYGHVLGKKNMTKIIQVLSRECEARGTDATGIAYLNRGKLTIYKRPVAANRLRFHLPSDCHVVMGHTRLTTQGDAKLNCNNHPFKGRACNTSFALAHNGMLYNDKLLQIEEELPITNIETDSYVAVQLIEKQKSLSFDSLRYMAEKVEGSFSFTVLDNIGNLYFVKGDSPLCIYHFDAGFYLYASTKDILEGTMKRLGLHRYNHRQIEIEGGDILRIDAQGNETREQFEFFDIHQWRSYGGCLGNYSYVLYDSDDYWNELRMMAGCFGYLPEEIDRLRQLGYSPDEVEEFLYCGSDFVNEVRSDYL